MCQHDFAGNRIFQHRNMEKWTRYGRNKRIEDFRFEAECLRDLARLNELWDHLTSGAGRFDSARRTSRERKAAADLTDRTFNYHRVGHDQRPMTLCPDGTVGEGRGGCEVYWDLREMADGMVLTLGSEHEPICRLRADVAGTWRGRWLRHEKMPIELAPLGT